MYTNKEVLKIMEERNAQEEQIIEWARMLDLASTEGGAKELAVTVNEVIQSMMYIIQNQRSIR